MKLVKKINNNYAIALDSTGEEIIVSGRGIGFMTMPCEITDLNIVDRTFYNVDFSYYDLLKSIPEDLIKIASDAVHMAEEELKIALNPNLTFALADHINFCIIRYRKKIKVKMPLSYDLEQQYPVETKIGFKTLEKISEIYNVKLRDAEAFGIALNIINSEISSKVVNSEIDEESIIKKITIIAEKELSISIDRKGFSYTRYATHMHYLIQRIQSKKQITLLNPEIYETLKNESPDAYNCSVQICKYLEELFHCKLNQEEKLYIILHINRLTFREDCNQ